MAATTTVCHQGLRVSSTKGVDRLSNQGATSHDEDLTGLEDISAGPFSAWLRQTRNALLAGSGVDVPCGECTACCRSSYFIHIRSAETNTLARINRKILFPAPGLPKGNVVLGYDQHGHCPMLRENQCSIYQHRPQTCRHYDCRIFAAAGIAAGDADKARINQRVQRWRFSYPSQRDRDDHNAVQAAAKYLLDHPECFPTGVTPANPSDVAILAITVYEVFLTSHEDHSNPGHTADDLELAGAIAKANAEFEARRDAAQR